jgi:UTP--glucose-1-phosphate uridylyltransferase
VSGAAGFAAFEAKMKRAGTPPIAIEAFRQSYRRLLAGESAWVAEKTIEPVTDLPALDALGALRAAGERALARCAVVKLNGGLATSMGMTRAKSLLPARDGLSFLEIIVRHIRRQRDALGAELPLIFMNSFRTHEDCVAALAAHPSLNGGLAVDFLQHRVPKVDAETLGPASWPGDPELEWYPPGHGDLYPALKSSGMLAALLKRGFEYAFVSNADNLGATLDPRVLGFFATERLSFLMEVTGRTHGDRKGGHLARRRRDGRLTLRESAQCAPQDRDAFENVERHRYFNTNNLWVHLPALAAALRESGGGIPLPVIQNPKRVDPRDPESTPVIQLETAMGSAISLFEEARAVAVPRDRFAPVKTTNDLLALRSDAYLLSDDYRVLAAPGSRANELRVDLDPEHFGRIDDFEARFADGPPSLVACSSLRVRGDVHFGADGRCIGHVAIDHTGREALRIRDGSELGVRA